METWSSTSILDVPGTVAPPYCHQFSCALELWGDTPVMLTRGCIPVYLSDNGCCPVTFRCRKYLTLLWSKQVINHFLENVLIIMLIIIFKMANFKQKAHDFNYFCSFHKKYNILFLKHVQNLWKLLFIQ